MPTRPDGPPVPIDEPDGEGIDKQPESQRGERQVVAPQPSVSTATASSAQKTLSTSAAKVATSGGQP